MVVLFEPFEVDYHFLFIYILLYVVPSVLKILPIQQNLVPVSFKKKLEYTGYYIQEYVDKEKVLIYFKWFKKYNHLFKDYELDESLITEYENRCMEKTKEMDTEKSTVVSDHNVTHRMKHNESEGDDIESDEEYHNDDTVGTEYISSQHSSLITDKYKENMDAPTVANKMASLVVELESKSVSSKKPNEKYSNPDPDEIFYSDDETFQSDEEDGDEEEYEVKDFKS